MQIVIDISERDYEDILEGEVKASSLNYTVFHAIRNGIPLPKGHGRLIDADEIRGIELEDSLRIIRHEKGDEIDVYIDAPTIIEADKESEDQSYKPLTEEETAIANGIPLPEICDIENSEIKNEIKDLSKRVEILEKQMKEDKEERLKKLKAEIEYARFSYALSKTKSEE